MPSQPDAFFPDPSLPDEQIRIENECLKMKLMLERGAEFGAIPGPDLLSPAQENRLLKTIVAFEAQAEKTRMIRVFDKLGRPAQFLPERSIPEGRIKDAWKELSEFLHQHRITVGVANPQVSDRELYRFVTTELFEQMISPVDLEGMMHGFIYDEFHPDPRFDAVQLALDGCLRPFFRVGLVERLPFLHSSGLRFNDETELGPRRFLDRFHRMQAGFDYLANLRFTDLHCKLQASRGRVQCKYSLDAIFHGKERQLNGDCEVGIILDRDSGCWNISSFVVTGMEAQ